MPQQRDRDRRLADIIAKRQAFANRQYQMMLQQQREQERQLQEERKRQQRAGWGQLGGTLLGAGIGALPYAIPGGAAIAPLTMSLGAGLGGGLGSAAMGGGPQALQTTTPAAINALALYGMRQGRYGASPYDMGPEDTQKLGAMQQRRTGSLGGGYGGLGA